MVSIQNICFGGRHDFFLSAVVSLVFIFQSLHENRDTCFPECPARWSIDFITSLDNLWAVTERQRLRRVLVIMVLSPCKGHLSKVLLSRLERKSTREGRQLQRNNVVREVCVALDFPDSVCSHCNILDSQFSLACWDAMFQTVRALRRFLMIVFIISYSQQSCSCKRGFTEPIHHFFYLFYYFLAVRLYLILCCFTFWKVLRDLKGGVCLCPV